MSAPLRKRMDAEREIALSRLCANTSKATSSYNALPERKRRTRAQVPGLTPPREAYDTKAEIVAKSIPALLTPDPTSEALSSPARRRAEADGFSQFGKRTWFLVQEGESFRAVESLDDASGWSLVKEMKR
jgi:hypothetical protein